MKYDVFISYSRKDSEVVTRFAKEISAAGYSVWMDVDGIESGDEFKKKIVSAIKESQIFVFFSSKFSNMSPWTVKEVNVAVNLKKTIIPIKLDNAVYDDSILFDLAGLDYIQCNNDRDSVAISKLAGVLKKKIGQGSTESFEPQTVASEKNEVSKGFDLLFPTGALLRIISGIEKKTFGLLASAFKKRPGNKRPFTIISIAVMCVVAAFFGIKSCNDRKTTEAETQYAIAVAEQQRIEADRKTAEAEALHAAAIAEQQRIEADCKTAEAEALRAAAIAEQQRIEADRKTAEAEAQRAAVIAEQQRIEADRNDKEEPERLAADNKRKEDTGRTAEKTCGVINGHEYVDLGLPSGLKWATCNVGATQPSEFGSYFAWGEAHTKSNYVPQTCSTYGEDLDDIAGDPSYDAACAAWGGSWRMPTQADFQELIDCCTWVWTKQKGNNGYKITGKNGKSIFLPACGNIAGKSSYNVGTGGYYWSSTPEKNNNGNACFLSFYGGDHFMEFNFRTTGYSVRPVCVVE